MMDTTGTPARAAREATGMSIEEAAARLRVSVDYLQRVERTGTPSYYLALRLANIYRAGVQTFLPVKRGKEKAGRLRTARPRRGR